MFHHGGNFGVRKTLVFVAVWSLAVFAAAGNPAAQTSNVYEVTGVAVDVTAETATAARDKALAEGHAKAFRRLLERMTLRADHPRLPDLTAGGIATYVQDFSVSEEKTSATRYLAKLDFRFKQDEVRRLLTDQGFRFAETLSKPVLVLPVYREAGAMLLWDTPNPWRDAWASLPAAKGLVPLLLPLGDLTDIAAIGAEQAARGDLPRLAAVAGRYGTDDSLVVLAARATDPQTGTTLLEVTISRYGTPGAEQTLLRTFAAREGETPEALFSRAAAEIMLEIEDGWKRDNLLHFEDPAVIAVSIPIRQLPDWLSIRERLSEVAFIRYTDLVLLSRSEVRVNLHFIGSEEQLILALDQADLQLTREPDGEWVLRSRGRG